MSQRCVVETDKRVWQRDLIILKNDVTLLTYRKEGSTEYKRLEGCLEFITQLTIKPNVDHRRRSQLLRHQHDHSKAFP
jgi:hypothetical protein